MAYKLLRRISRDKFPVVVLILSILISLVASIIPSQ